MKKTYLIFLITILCFEINAQVENAKEFHHGVLFSSKLESRSIIPYEIDGMGIEGGYYYLQQVSRKGALSIDIRIGYNQVGREYDRLLSKHNNSYLRDSIYTIQSGKLSYKNLAISIPIKYRYQFKYKHPLYLIIGINPYFTFWNKTKWRYDEILYNNVTGNNVSEENNQVEDFTINVFEREVFLIGIGYKKDRLMYDIYFSNGTVWFDDDYIGGMEKLSLALNVYYKLNQ